MNACSYIWPCGAPLNLQTRSGWAPRGPIISGVLLHQRTRRISVGILDIRVSVYRCIRIDVFVSTYSYRRIRIDVFVCIDVFVSMYLYVSMYSYVLMYSYRCIIDLFVFVLTYSYRPIFNGVTSGVWLGVSLMYRICVSVHQRPTHRHITLPCIGVSVNSCTFGIDDPYQRGMDAFVCCYDWYGRISPL